MITICNPKENEDERKEDMKKLAEKIEQNKIELLSTQSYPNSKRKS